MPDLAPSFNKNLVMKNNLETLRNSKISPPASSWRGIKDKLAKRKARQRIAFYRNMSIAACIVALIAIVFNFSESIHLHPKKTFATNHLYEPIVLEDLPMIKNDPFYDYNKILAIAKLPKDSHVKEGRSLNDIFQIE